MSWTQLINEVDLEPSHIVRVKKQVWNDDTQQFDRRDYVRIHCESQSQFNTLQAWLADQYGDPRVQGHWWVAPFGREVWMSDALATFWTLKNSDAR